MVFILFGCFIFFFYKERMMIKMVKQANLNALFSSKKHERILLFALRFDPPLWKFLQEIAEGRAMLIRSSCFHFRSQGGFIYQMETFKTRVKLAD